ncbi:TetR/AcrR family transcriptional regulator [Pseudonocardia broussonetiae]|uniref:TetR/AcrR family transcriptional regulator n=1 Tax=Pseudonocardia broussonetiae TaxID=2736640 RepID=A0A6M6JJM3_9PSEU|nr:TetR/AcrR family transcriptional regulator [Pseudonocardia broussonetiae]QJY47395.1 TetR/AcrR family transcriptional regulator [Pseudonocardia broussonetiae]
MTRAGTGSKAGDKRRRLIEAGLELMEELPYADITVAMIAERAKMARSLIFYYFTDKDALFRGVVHDLLDGLRRVFETNDLSLAQDPAVWLRREVEIFLEFMAAHPQAMATIVSQGWEDVEDDSGATMMDFTAGRVQQAFGAHPQDPLLDAALHSWASHCVDLAIRTRKTAPQADPETVAALLIGQLEAVFSTLRTDARTG